MDSIALRLSMDTCRSNNLVLIPFDLSRSELFDEARMNRHWVGNETPGNIAIDPWFVFS